MLVKIAYLLIFILFCFAQYLFLGNYSLKNDIVNNFITFLSIIFGFYITSLAIFVTSRYVSSLYKITDRDNKSRTLLHALVNNYKIGLTLILLTIFYLISFQFVFNQHENDSVLLSNIWATPLLGVFIINFWYSYKMLKDLIQVILQEAKSNSLQ